MPPRPSEGSTGRIGRPDPVWNVSIMITRKWMVLGLAATLSVAALATTASAGDYEVGSSTATVHAAPPPPPPPPPRPRPTAVLAVRG
jgi:hypothetical protein